METKSKEVKKLWRITEHIGRNLSLIHQHLCMVIYENWPLLLNKIIYKEGLWKVPRNITTISFFFIRLRLIQNKPRMTLKYTNFCHMQFKRLTTEKSQNGITQSNILLNCFNLKLTQFNSFLPTLLRCN